MWLGVVLFCSAVLLAIWGGRGVYRDYSERRRAWAIIGIVVTAVGTVALMTFTFIAGAVAGGP